MQAGRILRLIEEAYRQDALLSAKQLTMLRPDGDVVYWAVSSTEPAALSSPDLGGVADLILKHHEKWDGTGYPLGLKGEEIPIECRILSIVDAFDSITTGRPPCREKAVENALEEIRRYAGTRFDPKLAETFIETIAFDKSTFSEKKAATGHGLRCLRQKIEKAF
ncbi:MAG TPA: HD domain-containing protein [Syntrophomonadaceae bacterium]|nr:HD domain-containing protein [Syntrophomonadaceae bacterium]